jgi:hypothetical protein
MAFAVGTAMASTISATKTANTTVVIMAFPVVSKFCTKT